jgi:FtsH-binding integral membrane protein
MEKHNFNYKSTSIDATDTGLRSYLIRVYNYMSGGLFLTGLIAYLTSQSPELMNTLFNTPLKWLVMLAPLAFMLFLSFGINRISSTKAQLIFWLFASSMGLSISSIFLVYTGLSIAKTFFITATMFLAMSIYGYTTKSDLTRFGSFLIMGLFGIIIASIVNIFLKSSTLELVVSIAGVLIFTGLTAYDTQKIKLSYQEQDDSETNSKKAVLGAITLYLDFINLFLMLLRLLGNRRSE